MAMKTTVITYTGNNRRPRAGSTRARFKDLLRKIVAVPKKEADERAAELRERRDTPESQS
jgi:hypothetical protein